MLFFPPPPPTTTDLVVNPTVDGLLLNGALMPMPSLLEQEQRNQELQRQLVMMEQQLQQQHVAHSAVAPFSACPATVSAIPFDGLFPAVVGPGTLLGPSIQSLPGISPPSTLLTQLVPQQSNQQHQIGTINSGETAAPPNGQQQIVSLQPTGPCGSCNQAIVDKSFLLVDGQSWHPECVRCAVCGNSLEREGPTCFVRDGFLFCQRDYFLKFGKPCERCGVPIARGEMVMRVPRCTPTGGETALFHVHCFSCVCCGQLLSPGQQYTVGPSDQPGGPLFCNEHFHLNPIPGTFGQFPPSGEEQNHFMSEQASIKVLEQLSVAPNSPTGNNNRNNINQNVVESRNSFRKCMENSEAILCSRSVSPNGTEGQHCGGGNGGGSSNGGDDISGMGGSASGRQKRMRTSFKHHQLRTMKTYFSLNHNPDAKDLKQLAQKTGLTKRVLQVWFQNARAKFRRSQQHRSGGGGGNGMDMSAGMVRHIAQGPTAGGAGGAIHGGYAPNGVGGEIMLTIPAGPPPPASDPSPCNGPASLDECSMITSASFSSSNSSEKSEDQSGGGGDDSFGGGSQQPQK